MLVNCTALRKEHSISPFRECSALYKMIKLDVPLIAICINASSIPRTIRPITVTPRDECAQIENDHYFIMFIAWGHKSHACSFYYTKYPTLNVRLIIHVHIKL